jgi:hypothetical protein
MGLKLKLAAGGGGGGAMTSKVFVYSLSASSLSCTALVEAALMRTVCVPTGREPILYELQVK